MMQMYGEEKKYNKKMYLNRKMYFHHRMLGYATNNLRWDKLHYVEHGHICDHNCLLLML